MNNYEFQERCEKEIRHKSKEELDRMNMDEFEDYLEEISQQEYKIARELLVDLPETIGPCENGYCFRFIDESGNPVNTFAGLNSKDQIVYKTEYNIDKYYHRGLLVITHRLIDTGEIIINGNEFNYRCNTEIKNITSEEIKKMTRTEIDDYSDKEKSKKLEIAKELLEDFDKEVFCLSDLGICNCFVDEFGNAMTSADIEEVKSKSGYFCKYDKTINHRGITIRQYRWVKRKKCTNS